MPFGADDPVGGAAMTPEEIAAGLTKAQRDWLLRHQDRSHTDDAIEALQLADMGLARPLYCRITRDFGHVATELGLAVRAILEKDHG